MSDQATTMRKGRKSGLRVVVLGYLVRGPLGGMAWHHLQYVVGLARLGHDVLFVEHGDDWASCVHLTRDEVDHDPEEGLAFATDAMGRLGLGDRWCYHDAYRSQWRGPAAPRAEAFCRSCDVVLNLSGINVLRPWVREAPRRVLVDTDPVFTQVRHLQSEEWKAYAAGHNVFFTFGERFGQPGASVPDDGLPWQPTRQPVVLDAWRADAVPEGGRLTTIMQWDSYRTVEHGGVSYGMKSATFEPYRHLPGRSRATLELAIGGASQPPRRELEAAGWRVTNPLPFTRTPWDYRDYIFNSLGEFSVAKHGYVVSRSGWFSERSANYLAAGRPVIVQDTGWRKVLPSGEGLLGFDDPDEAAAGIEAVLRDPKRHGRAAREIASAHFDAGRVLTDLLARTEAGAASSRGEEGGGLA